MARKTQRENYVVRTFNGLAYGYFLSFVIGTLLKQIGNAVHWSLLYQWGVIVTYLMGPVIAIAIAWVIDARGMNLVASVIAGTIGAGTVVVDGSQVTLQSGNPLMAYLAIILSVEVIRLVQDKTPLDIFLLPFLAVLCSGLLTRFLGPYISQLVVWFGHLINQGVSMQPVLMGMVVALFMGIASTSPLSSATIGIMLGLDGLAAGAAMAGCCGQMIGFAVMSINDNNIIDVLAIAIGTSMLQFKNILRRPVIWIPPLIASLVCGLVSSIVGIQCSSFGSGMGMMALIGLTESIQIMGMSYWLPLILVDVLLPMAICYSMYKAFRKLNYIKSGDMHLSGL